MFIEDVTINVSEGLITDLFGDHPFSFDESLWKAVRNKGLTNVKELNNEFLNSKKQAKKYIKALSKVNSTEVSMSDVDLGDFVTGTYFIKEPLTYQEFLLYKVLFLHTKEFADYEELLGVSYTFGDESGTLTEIGSETLTFLIQSGEKSTLKTVPKSSNSYFLMNHLRWFKAPKETLTESLDWFSHLPESYLGKSREWVMLMFDVQEVLYFTT